MVREFTAVDWTRSFGGFRRTGMLGKRPDPALRRSRCSARNCRARGELHSGAGVRRDPIRSLLCVMSSAWSPQRTTKDEIFSSSEESLFEFCFLFQIICLRLFLLEEATESIYGVSGILPCALVVLEESGRRDSRVRWKRSFANPPTSGIISVRGRALNLERNFQTSLQALPHRQ